MRTVVALLRAVNVGGTGLLSMPMLAEVCRGAGFEQVRTYIQSGNVVMRSRLSVPRTGAALERALENRTGVHIDVIAREASDLRAVLEANPFAGEPPNRVSVFFCADLLPPGLLAGLTGPAGEQVAVRDREFYVFYPIGMGASKLKLPKLGTVATARNINTVTKLVAMCEA